MMMAIMIMLNIMMTMMMQVREKEEAWRKYKDAVEEGKTAGGRIYSDHDDVQELDMMSTIFQEISSKYM